MKNSTIQLLVALFLLASFSVNAQQVNKSYIVKSKDLRTGLPSFVELNEEIKIQDFQSWFKRNFKLEDKFVLVLKNKQTDELNKEHYYFNLYYKSDRVFGSNIIVYT